MLLRGPENVLISPPVVQTRLQCLASVMPKSVMPSAQQLSKCKVSKEKKRKDLAASAKPPRLNRFLQNFQAATLKQYRQPEHLKM